ncbi:unnamed protein product [Cylicocyclus nassatus]|uniref:Uncharacterized protein n=1 Tax=Cylicocyclus nassatus TaxID=53992 RepID=A0AA36MG28_CYLNA|nr:unnamed protein product [Cylicocyclus nassatus]
MRRFDGKVAIVTGSSSGIGAGTALLFAKEGARVTITSNKTEELEATRQSIIKDSGCKEDDILAIPGDILDDTVKEKIVSDTVAKWGRIDILVNNVGGMLPDENGSCGLSGDISYLKKTMDLNTYSAVQMVKLCRPYLIKAKGEIVNVSSIGAMPFGCPRWAYYSMAKAAQDQLTRALAIDLIAEGVRVNAVRPGTTRTNFCVTAGMKPGAAEELYKAAESSPDTLPIRKCGEPEDIANLIAFLADRSQSRYMIGQTVTIDGGSMLVNCSDATAFKE